MELVLNQKLESEPEPISVLHYTKNGLLNSNYKSIVKNNYSSATAKTLFGIRQRLRSAQLSRVNHAAVILKLSVFVVALVAIF